MEFKDYQKRSYTAIQPHENEKDEILNWAVGLSEEVGEIMNHIKHRFWGKEPFDQEEMAKELGDVLWYTAALSTTLNLNLDTIADLNVSKLEHRFGGSFSVQKSMARHQAETKFSETEKYKQLMSQLKLKEETL